MKAQKHSSLPVPLTDNEIHTESTSFLPKLSHCPVFLWAILMLCLFFPKQGFGQLIGTYTIDSTKAASKTNYVNLSSAISDLDSGKRHDGGLANGIGVNGPVIFKIANGVYNFPGSPTNPTVFEMISIPGNSEANSITFTSASSDSSKVLLSNCIIVMRGLSNITFSELGFSQQLVPADVCISFDDCNNLTFTHCLFMVSKESVALEQYDTDSSDNVSISHCNFQGTGRGIQLNWNKNLSITDNMITNAPALSGLANGNYSFLSTFGCRNLIISNNTFFRNVDTGFYINAKGFYISNNRILANTGIGIGGADSTADTIVNNVLITHQYGIYDVDYYNYENVTILDNNIYTDSVGVSGSGACIFINNTYEPFNSIMDNNIENGPGRAGIYFASTKLRGTINYNNYYYTDSFGYFGAKYADLNSFQLATGLERNGLNINPQYDLADYLETGNANLEGKGIIIPGVKYDIEGILRNPVAPTIGAYEINTSDSINVWPGDANNDGRVDINDLLAIGVTYGYTGPKRSNASTDWTPQPCNDWSGTFKNGVNEKFADCNGNGIVDSNDVSVIALNFTKPHYKTLIPASGSPTDPPLTVKFSQDSVQAGDSVTAIISLGSNAIKANNIYGVTLSVNYGAYMLTPKSIATDFAKSWLGTIHKDMVSLVVNDSVNQVLNIGLTRTDHNNMSGAGEIGQVSIYMPDNVAGKREVKQYFNLEIIDYKSIDQNQDTIPLNPTGDSTVVYEYKAGITNAGLKNTGLNIYPNPARNSVNVIADNNLINSITVTDILGKAVCQSINDGAQEVVLPVGSLSSGVYFIYVMTSKGIYQTRFIKE